MVEVENEIEEIDENIDVSMIGKDYLIDFIQKQQLRKYFLIRDEDRYELEWKGKFSA
ncbi:MAG: hypothetical protein ACXAAI_06020 [Promethearchaeota archaeon]